jgi:CheY-like chemotaxis protein
VDKADDNLEEFNTVAHEAGLLRLGVAMNAELDRIKYPARPARGKQLAIDVGIVRTGAYKTLNGMQMPSWNFLKVLRGAGVSLDKLFDAYLARSPEIKVVTIDGNSMATIVNDASDMQRTPIYRKPWHDGTFVLRTLAPGEELPENGIPVASLEFVVMPLIALLDDDKDIRTTISDGLAPQFNTVTFSSSSKLMAYGKGVGEFSAFILDWRLPDDPLAGEDLIKEIRNQTNAPIFILTGEADAGMEIVQAMQNRNVHFLAKPMDIATMQKRLKDVIGR